MRKFKIQTIFHDQLVAVTNLRQFVLCCHHLFDRAIFLVPGNGWFWHSCDLNVHDDAFTLLNDLSLKSSSENGREN